VNPTEDQYSMHNDILDAHHHIRNMQNVSGFHSLNTSISQTFASVMTSAVSRNSTSDPHYVARVCSPALPHVGVRITSDYNCSHSTLYLQK
jgi:pumilio RNA-binding family